MKIHEVFFAFAILESTSLLGKQQIDTMKVSDINYWSIYLFNLFKKFKGVHGILSSRAPYIAYIRQSNLRVDIFGGEETRKVTNNNYICTATIISNNCALTTAVCLQG